MIIDNHVHVGWFTDGYHSPWEVWNSEMAAGIDGMAVSSTSTCAELYKVVVREMRELVRIGGNRIYPILWLTPKMMKRRYALPFMLHSKVRWRGIKMHWGAHPEWAHNAKLVERGLGVAKQLKVPVLLHTGNYENCHAGKFAEIIQNNNDLTFVLAHGRPIEEAIELINKCSNVFVDTAFMPMSDLRKILDIGLIDKVLFGTDAPINRVFYKDMDTVSYIKSQVDNVNSIVGYDADCIFNHCVY